MPRTRSLIPSLLASLGAGLLALPAAPADAPAEPAEVSIKVFKDRIEFRHGKKLAGTYHMGTEAAKPYFWPLNAPSGVAVTRAWPMEPAKGEARDHPHQKSAWFCHGDVIPDGVALKEKTRHAAGVDFWSEEPGHGRIVCTRVGAVKRAKDHARVTTHNEWRTGDDVKILDETRTIHFHDFGTARLFVLDIDLHASVCPITFGDTKEGSLGVRVRERLRVDRGKGKLVNAEGKSGEGKKNNARRDGCWGLFSAWCDYSGPADGKLAGIALFADPSNPYRTAWHSRDYGLMAANPFGRAKAGFPDTKVRKDLVKLARGEHLKLRYGIFLHDGDAREGKVAHYYKRFTKLKTPDK